MLADLRSHRRFLPTAALALTVTALATSCASPSIEATRGDVADDEDRHAALDVIGELSRVRGPGGLHEVDGPAGVFLGAGAALRGGQVLESPKGVRAELRFDGDVIVRVDEDTRIELPAHAAGELSLRHGEIVVFLGRGELQRAAATPMTFALGDATITPTTAHAELVLRAGESGAHVSVVAGSATLVRGEDEATLDAGSSLDLPGPAGGALAHAGGGGHAGGNPPPTLDRKPLTQQVMQTLEPLRRSAWAHWPDAPLQPNPGGNGEPAPVALAIDAQPLPEGVGSLFARRAGSQSTSQRLRIVDQRVTVKISGRIARTEIEQAFHNDAGEQLEGTYRFPLPADASIADLQLLVGNRWMTGEMLEKARARRIFKSIVDATIPRDPALLEWQHGNEFKLRIFPIPAHGERRVRIAYTQVLPRVGDALRYRYPMNGSGAGGTEIEQFAFDIDLDPATAGRGVGGLPTRSLEFERRDEGGRVRLSAREQGFIPRGDIGVDVPAPPSDADQDTFLDRDGQAYFSKVVVVPALDVVRPERVNWAFVVDRSHGITPELWQLQRGLLQVAVDRLDPRDAATVLACDTACDEIAGGLRAAQERRASAISPFLDDQTLAGATDVGEMLRQANARLGPPTPGVERVIVLLSDGVATSGELTPEALLTTARRELADARIEAIALGGRSDTALLDALAAATGGDVLRADPGDDLSAIARELALRSRVPALRDLELDLPAGAIDVHPKQLPSLRAGDEVMVVGKMTRPIEGTIGLRQRGRIDPIVTFPIALAADATSRSDRAAHLPRTWAQHEITWLTQTQGEGARERATTLSVAHNVISRWTALLVLENDAMYREFGVARRAGGTTGWDGTTADAAAPAEIAGGQPADTTTGTIAVPDAVVPYAEPGGGSSREDDGAAHDPWERQTEARESAAASQSRGNAPSQEEAESFAFDEHDGDGADKANKKSSASGAPGDAKSKGAPAPKPSSPHKDMALEDDFGWGGGSAGGASAGFGSGGYGRSAHTYYRPPYGVSRAKTASASTGAHLRELAARRDADPTKRSLHRRLVRAAIVAGDPSGLAWAEAWAKADPDHSAALTSLADLLAAKGEPLAARAYASAVEATPWDEGEHRQRLRAHLQLGDVARACSHARALVSLDPRDLDAQAWMLGCQRVLGQDASDASVVGSGRSANKHNKLARAAVLARGDIAGLLALHSGSGPVRVELTWSDPSAELDLAVVDDKGRRKSILHDEGLAFVQAPQRESVRTKVDGSVHIEVTRRDPGTSPVSARLDVHAEGVTRHYDVSVDRGTLRIAKIRYSALRYGGYHPW